MAAGGRAPSLHQLLPPAIPSSRGALPRLLESLQGSDVAAGVDYWDLSSPCSLEILRFLRLH